MKHKTVHQTNTEHKSGQLELHVKESHYHQKNTYWYIGMAVLLLALTGAAIAMKEYLLAGVVVAFGIVIFKFADQHPGSKRLTISTKGVAIGDQFYGYHQLKAFWTSASGDKVVLTLQRLNLLPEITALLSPVEAQQATQALSDFLPWHPDRQESANNRLSRLLRL